MKTFKKNYRFWLGTFLVVNALAMSSNAYGYVDPGLMASLYQVLYVAIFGVALGFVVKPVNAIKGFYQRIKLKLGPKD
jgi:hypothetical protein